MFKNIDAQWVDFVYYDASSPSGLRWKTNRFSGRKHGKLAKKAGDVAGSFCRTHGYWHVSLKQEGSAKIASRAHRVVLSLHGIEVPPSHDVDHSDGNKKNNTLENLRVVTRRVNSANRNKRHDNSSNFTGVQWHFHKKSNITSAVCRWSDLDGKRKQKYFSVNKLGLLPAFKEATLFRTLMLQQIGIYTVRHGL